MDVAAVKAKHELNLIQQEGVVGVGATPTHIVVYVDNPSVFVPLSLEGVPVIKRVVGGFRIL